MPFDRPIKVETGDRVEVEISASLTEGNYIWRWNSAFHLGNRAEPAARFRQSTFSNRVISPASLKSRESGYVPAPTPSAEADSYCLGLIDGRRSLGGIAQELWARFPERFKTSNDALNHVANLTARYC